VTKAFGTSIKAEVSKNNEKHINEKINENNDDKMSYNRNIIHGVITPYGDSKGLDRWIELAYTEWAEDMNDHLIQIEGNFCYFSKFLCFNITDFLIFL
jgi:hypothetical protein